MSLRRLFLTALYRFGSYPELIKVKGGRTFLYSVILMIFGAAVTIAASAPGYIMAGGFAGIAEKALPEFAITDGQLKWKRWTAWINRAVYIFTWTPPKQRQM